MLGRFYTLLLRFYPAAFRRRFGAELTLRLRERSALGTAARPAAVLLVTSSPLITDADRQRRTRAPLEPVVFPSGTKGSPHGHIPC